MNIKIIVDETDKDNNYIFYIIIFQKKRELIFFYVEKELNIKKKISGIYIKTKIM